MELRKRGRGPAHGFSRGLSSERMSAEGEGLSGGGQGAWKKVATSPSRAPPAFSCSLKPRAEEQLCPARPGGGTGVLLSPSFAG